MARPALIVHGGAGPSPVAERPLRQAAVERALAAGWAVIGNGALVAAVAAVRQLEDEPLLNAGIGACLNLEGDVELWAGVTMTDYTSIVITRQQVGADFGPAETVLVGNIQH